jgi:hypothetical protein
MNTKYEVVTNAVPEEVEKLLVERGYRAPVVHDLCFFQGSDKVLDLESLTSRRDALFENGSRVISDSRVNIMTVGTTPSADVLVDELRAVRDALKERNYIAYVREVGEDGRTKLIA